MTIYEKLDWILTILNDYQVWLDKLSLYDKIRDSIPNELTNDIDSLLVKIVNDKYVDMEVVEELGDYGQTLFKKYYRITTAGQLFIFDGGYRQIVAERNSLKEIQKEQRSLAKRLYYLNIVLAAGTIISSLYYSLEILDKHYPICSFPFWTAVFLALFLTIGILIIWLAMKEITQQRKKD